MRNSPCKIKIAGCAKTAPQTIRILSIDGGGIRGIIPAMLLAEIERRTQQPIASLFHLVAGTSTGGILALGLTVPRSAGWPPYTAQQFVSMYTQKGRRIFHRSFWRKLFAVDNLAWKKYSCAGMEQVLLEYFGDGRLSDTVTDVLIASYEIERRLPFFFRSTNARQRPDYDFPARHVARATSAAPSYFEPMRLVNGAAGKHYTLIDGGVFANNPAACALVEARAIYPRAGAYVVVSLGTGSSARSLPLRRSRYWGAALWAKPLLDVVFDGVSSTVDYQLRQLLPDKCYYRFQTALTGYNHSFDNAGRRNIAGLQELARNLIEKESGKLEELCHALLTSPS
jgi:patatin-like phospholipase/acyl hydrolase